MQRVLQVTHDTRLPDGYVLHEQRPDETEMCEGRNTHEGYLCLMRRAAPLRFADKAGWLSARLVGSA